MSHLLYDDFFKPTQQPSVVNISSTVLVWIQNKNQVKILNKS